MLVKDVSMIAGAWLLTSGTPPSIFGDRWELEVELVPVSVVVSELGLPLGLQCSLLADFLRLDVLLFSPLRQSNSSKVIVACG